MANEVYANDMEISCKAASGKSIAAFPDVCFTPPQAPPTPMGVPIPYPNTGLAKDTTKGTRTVRITRKEVMLKNKSYFKTSYGDEAGRAPKKGVITSKIKGKVYFTSWSMNVKFESKNVVRHMDLTTHNHGSQPGNTMTWTYADRMAYAKGLSQCDDERTRAKDACGDTSKKVVCPDISALKKASAARAAAKKKPVTSSRTMPITRVGIRRCNANFPPWPKRSITTPARRPCAVSWPLTGRTAAALGRPATTWLTLPRSARAKGRK